MDIVKEQIDELNAVVKIKLTPDDYEPKVEKTLKEHSRKVSMPGFRPGKVPFGMVRKMYGKSVLVDEINKILSDALYKYISENKLEILGNPLPKSEDADAIDWENQKEFEFAYDLGFAPEFELKIDKKKEFDFYSVAVAEEDIDKQMEDLRKRYGKMSNSEEVGDSDIIYAELTELDENGSIMEGGIKKTVSIAMETITEEETKTKLTGLKKEESINIDPHKISDYILNILSSDGEGNKEVGNNFNLTVQVITKIQPAELNQELFDKIFGEGSVASEEDFRNKIKEDIKSLYQNDVDIRFFNSVSEYLIDNLNISLPDGFLKKWLVAVSEKPVTAQEIENDYDKYSKSLKWQLIENKIIKDHNLKVENEEVMLFTKEIIKNQFARYGRVNISDEELEETAKRILGNKEEVRKIYEKLFEKKTIDLFKSEFKLNEKAVSLEEFYKVPETAEK
jgi:trigger factor